MNIKKLIALLVLALLVTANAFCDREVFNMNPAWSFFHGDPSGAYKVEFNDGRWDIVSVPHSMRIFSADLSDFKKYGRTVGWYRKKIDVPASWLTKKVHLEFQGAMQITDLYVNGAHVGQYAVSGYDSFNFDITPFIKEGVNLIAVKVDNRVNKNIPPDGITHDFVLFGGLYRDVNLVVTDTVRIPFAWEKANSGVFVTYPTISKEQATVDVKTCVNNETASSKNITLLVQIKEKGSNKVVATTSESVTIAANGSNLFSNQLTVNNPKLWSPDKPNLYIVETIVKEGSSVCDTVKTQVGLRWCKWDPKEGFFLNGEHLKLIGTNRHQNWPYITGAVSNENHYEEAKQLKSLGINWIRCSHYPHDPDFLTALDEVGLMALEEGPTWMRRGPSTWIDNLEKSFTSMIRRDRNHPSIIIWNACINHETKAEPRLKAAGHREDPTRVLGADDIYCPMDFMHPRVSSHNALTLEHTGHTYPTRRGGQYDREIEQARRHMEMYKNSLATPGNHGMASWCGYDYNSFYNSEENAARHGIFDLFRLPKLSYYWHRSELVDEPIAHIVKSGRNVVVYSNADKIVLYGGVRKDSLDIIETKTKPVDGKLKNPPYYFTVDASIPYLEAKGYKGDKLYVVGTWATPLQEKRLVLNFPRESITADGSDVARIEVSVVDDNGTVVPKANVAVTFSIESGDAQIIGENPIGLIDGKHIVLVQSGYKEGDIVVKVKAHGLESDTITIKQTKIKGNVIYPVDFKAAAPTPFTYKVRNKKSFKGANIVEQFSFNPKNGNPGEWVESDVVLVGGITKDVNISITGGEYRIYVSEYSSKAGKVGGGDAVFVRVKAGEKSGDVRTATLRIGDKRADFVVKTN